VKTIDSPLSHQDPRVSRPLFTLRQAARVLAMPASTLYGWARCESGAPLITTLPVHGHDASVPFVGFAEAFVLQAARRAGVPDHRVRPGVESIKQEFPIEFALAHKRVFTDGAELLLRVLDDEDLEVARTNQRQFTDTVRTQLQVITYADDGFAERLRLPQYKALVTVDPLIASGQPLVESGGVRVKDLVDRANGGESAKAIARDFDVPLKEVLDVLGNTRATARLH
jgi:uncharacterized protein (DUF433 family)